MTVRQGFIGLYNAQIAHVILYISSLGQLLTTLTDLIDAIFPAIGIAFTLVDETKSVLQRAEIKIYPKV